MSALASLRAQGLRVRAEGDRLLVEPKEALTEAVRQDIRANKATLLSELAAEATAPQEPQGDAVRVREARQTKVESELRAHPEKRVVFDATDVPLAIGPGTPVSVVLAIRHGEQILSGEVLIPRERWDLAEFLSTLNEPPVRPS